MKTRGDDDYGAERFVRFRPQRYGVELERAQEEKSRVRGRYTSQTARTMIRRRGAFAAGMHRRSWQSFLTHTLPQTSACEQDASRISSCDVFDKIVKIEELKHGRHLSSLLFPFLSSSTSTSNSSSRRSTTTTRRIARPSSQQLRFFPRHWRNKSSDNTCEGRCPRGIDLTRLAVGSMCDTITTAISRGVDERHLPPRDDHQYDTDVGSDNNGTNYYYHHHHHNHHHHHARVDCSDIPSYDLWWLDHEDLALDVGCLFLEDVERYGYQDFFPTMTK